MEKSSCLTKIPNFEHKEERSDETQRTPGRRKLQLAGIDDYEL